MKIINLDECFKKNKYEYFFLESTNSTMDDIKKRIKKKSKNYIVRTNQQKKGRGRRGSKWLSPSGNMYCSFAFNTDLLLNDFFIYSIIMSFAIKDSLEYIGMKNIFFKWPNDIYYKDNKISGMILESFKDEKNMKFAIIGIGLNFISSPRINNYKTTHVLAYINNVNIDEYFKIFINYYFFYINQNNYLKRPYFIERYKESLMFLGEEIKIKISNNKILKGIFNGINKDGSLILKQNDNFIQIYSGQILI